MLYKIIAKAFICLVAAFIAVWIFNHVNAWAGILAFIALGSYLLNQIYKFIKQL